MNDLTPALLPVGGSFEIEYINADGIRSRRLIDVKKFVSNRDDGHVQAYCHARRMSRTFKYKSVCGLTDAETGEVLDPAAFRHILCERYEAAPEREMDFFIREMRPILDVLVFVAYCDGKYVPSEQRYIAEFLTEKSEMGETFLHYAQTVMKDFPVPDSMDFKFSVRAINQRFPEWKEAVLEYADGVAKADRKITAEETENLALLERLFKAAN
ncbi:TPA: TerB family tellurite resistance protein [Neisseria lactamica]